MQHEGADPEVEAVVGKRYVPSVEERRTYALAAIDDVETDDADPFDDGLGSHFGGGAWSGAPKGRTSTAPPPQR